MVNPTYLEIRDVLATAGLAPIVENKKHPRERSNEIEFRGRIRVQLKNEDGTPFKEEFKTRELTQMYLFALDQWSLPTVDHKLSNFISVYVYLFTATCTVLELMIAFYPQARTF